MAFEPRRVRPRHADDGGADGFDGHVGHGLIPLSDAKLEVVMAGLDPAIHEAVHQTKTYCSDLWGVIMDCRVEPGNDSRRGRSLGTGGGVGVGHLACP